MADKLHIGCGNVILEGWVNQDLAPLPGVDSVHDLAVFPWPYEDNRFDEALMINVLEHLPDTVRTMEELHRIMAHGGKLTLRVPYWNSPDMAGDPTHKVFFSESSFDFFDPTTRHGIERPYYSTARFKIHRKIYYIKFFKFLKIYNPTLQRIITVFAHKLCGIIWSLEMELIALKENNK